MNNPHTDRLRGLLADALAMLRPDALATLTGAKLAAWRAEAARAIAAAEPAAPGLLGLDADFALVRFEAGSPAQVTVYGFIDGDGWMVAGVKAPSRRPVRLERAADALSALGVARRVAHDLGVPPTFRPARAKLDGTNVTIDHKLDGTYSWFVGVNVGWDSPARTRCASLTDAMWRARCIRLGELARAPA